MLEEEKPCTMKTAYIDSEEDVRCILMNTLFRKGVSVWDCPAEIGKCDDPILKDNVPFGIPAGDFPFFLDGIYYIVELKFLNVSCRFRSGRGRYESKMGSAEIAETQSNMILEGGGILVMIREQPPSKYGLKQLWGNSLKECYQVIEERYKQLIATDQILYEAYILDSERYQIYYEEVYEGKEPRTHKKQKVRDISIAAIQSLLPEAVFEVTLSEFKQGAVARAIIDLIRGGR
ncbi:MAG: hypothetical protein HWN65_04435 [Candidatus Helarchaeota archaeon]|nr:hypothetical protein [Candidatus Helarchaeota archaeon]